MGLTCSVPSPPFQIASAINEGKPVLEEIIFRLLSKRLEEGYCNGESGFILEGIPRNRNQAVCLSSFGWIDNSSPFIMICLEPFFLSFLFFNGIITREYYYHWF